MKLPLLQVETERLIIRPFQKEDYESWLDGFNKRLPSQYKYDDGYHDMSSSTKEWFTEWIRGFDEAARRDEMYVLGIFQKEDGANIGKLELIKILRMDYQWAMMGYSIHNQHWKNGYGAERAGFSFECTREAFSMGNGKWADFLIYYKNNETNK
ncbi:GNAT family N-acetyltransferase [Bacillus mycoides]|uniref:GNAT family N-acetyltransferase n=1 Tax=Bacillus mycoides TaxID=1405 RepID=A0A4U3ADP9_BACMY|nr:GNAT family N-acetyltransferase [Bacillus mycoides]TKI85609.1 GNAT family N-acetyltransferase [Bacillus mycoides]